MSGRTIRHVDPEYARQAALRGATLLVLVSIVMAGAPLDRGEFVGAAASQAHREARVVQAGERAVAAASSEETTEHGAAAGRPAVPAVESMAGVERAPAGVRGVVRPQVRVALLDLPPPAL